VTGANCSTSLHRASCQATVNQTWCGAHGSTKEKALDFASRACAGGISQGTPCGAVNAPQGMADVVFLTGQPRAVRQANFH